MSVSNNPMKYDEVLTQILVNEKSILGFLAAIFNFLGRRTDFYYVPQDPNENMGFPPGIAEELVIKVLRKCDPKNWKPPNCANKSMDISNEIMCSTVAQEVEVITDENSVDVQDEPVEDLNKTVAEKPTISSQVASSSLTQSNINEDKTRRDSKDSPSTGKSSVSLEPPPVIPTQKNSETYNGAERENYSWSQTIMELDITVKLPANIKSSKDLKVTINSGDICVAYRNGDILLKDTFLHKIKSNESIWSISAGKLLIHLEKVQERWWNKFLNSEEPIDLDRIDCSRPLYELPDDHIAKVRELQWNQEQKQKGLPTSDQLRNIGILKKAWNADGSPFKGKEFDPSVLQNFKL